MATIPAVKSQTVPKVEEDIKKIRITLTSTKVDSLEKICADIKSKAIAENAKVTGPVRMPTKKLSLMVRKSPCGEGTNTFDRWQMRIHKRVIDLHATTNTVKSLTNIKIEAGVDVEVVVAN